ncbi:hypothetical protein Tco_0059892 [Tanacetum coccineum]
MDESAQDCFERSYLEFSYSYTTPLLQNQTKREEVQERKNKSFWMILQDFKGRERSYVGSLESSHKESLKNKTLRKKLLRRSWKKIASTIRYCTVAQTAKLAFKEGEPNHKGLSSCLLPVFYLNGVPKKFSEALEDENLPYGKKAIGTKWVYRNKKDERGVVIDEEVYVFTQVSKIIKSPRKYTMWLKLCMGYNQAKSLDKYVDESEELDFAYVKSAVHHRKTRKPLSDEEANCACSSFKSLKDPSHLTAVKRIFRYLKGKPQLGLWYPRESTFDLESYSDSDYAGANLDRKST